MTEKTISATEGRSVLKKTFVEKAEITLSGLRTALH